MKITLEVSDRGKAGLLVEFLKSLNYVNVKEPKASEALPDWHIAILQQRMKDFKQNKNKAVDFDEAMKQIEAGL